MKLTIITPVFNSEQFIESCINNVVEQKCLDFEHLIIDGESTDKTMEIVKKYAAQYAHIRWVSESDKGQSDAMNKGIKLAKGEIISFLNADDGYFTYTLNRIITIFDANPQLNFIAGNCKLYDLAGNLIYINRPQRLKSYHLYSDLEPFPINPAAYFYKKDIHESVGGYSMENHYNMDYEFILKTALKYNLVYFNEDWGYAVHHENAKTVQDTANNTLMSRKRETLQKLYKNIPIQVKLLSVLYKIKKMIYA